MFVYENENFTSFLCGLLPLSPDCLSLPQMRVLFCFEVNIKSCTLKSLVISCCAFVYFRETRPRHTNNKFSCHLLVNVALVFQVQKLYWIQLNNLGRWVLLWVSWFSWPSKKSFDQLNQFKSWTMCQICHAVIQSLLFQYSWFGVSIWENWGTLWNHNTDIFNVQSQNFWTPGWFG